MAGVIRPHLHLVWFGGGQRYHDHGVPCVPSAAFANRMEEDRQHHYAAYGVCLGSFMIARRADEQYGHGDSATPAYGVRCTGPSFVEPLC